MKNFLDLLRFFKSRYPESLEFLESFSSITPINPIAGLNLNSKNIQPGEVFIALAGNKLDGRDYIRQAIDNGASGVLIEILEHEEIENLMEKNKEELWKK